MTAIPPFELAALSEKAGDVTRLLKLLANERRLLILCSLAGSGEMSVSALAGAVGLSQSALSQHLALMRADGVVGFRRDGQTLHYAITDPAAARFLLTLKTMYCAGDPPPPNERTEETC